MAYPNGRTLVLLRLHEHLLFRHPAVEVFVGVVRRRRDRGGPRSGGPRSGRGVGRRGEVRVEVLLADERMLTAVAPGVQAGHGAHSLRPVVRRGGSGRVP